MTRTVGTIVVALAVTTSLSFALVYVAIGKFLEDTSDDL